MTPQVALVTTRAARGLDEDLPLLERAMQAAGAQPHIVDWDDPVVDWSAFDIALLRSTWDYFDRLREFLAWVETCARQTLLLNPPEVVRWNTDKHYLAELARAAVPAVPSTFIEPGDNAADGVHAFLARHPETTEFVVKPAVSGGSRDTQRHAEAEPAVAQAKQLLDAGRSVLLQPYLANVDRDGETALIYFRGQFSHAICKAAILPPGLKGSPVVGLFAPERITPREPGRDELWVAQRALDSLPFAAPLYARVDLIRDAAGVPTVLELELTEPSLYFTYASGAAERFTAVVLDVARSI
jgi:O-ureido-D-serine cyclo-ligase